MTEFLFRFDKPRAMQGAMMKDIYAAVSNKRSVLINAPTGVGKTDASITAALAHSLESGSDVFFLTPKISQHAIALEVLEGINRKFNAGIRYTDIVGKRNLCINTNVNELDSEVFYGKCEKLIKSKSCDFYNNSKEEGRVERLAAKGAIGHNAFFRDAFDAGVCAYEALAFISKKSNFIIADYAHLLNPSIKESFMKKISHRLENSILIWDEAHNILGAAGSYFSISISMRGVERAKKELEAIGSNVDIDYIGFVISEAAKKRLGIEKQEAFFDDSDMPSLISENTAVANQLEAAAMEYITKSEANGSSLMHIAKFVRSLRQMDESIVRIVSRNGSNPKLSLTCLYPKSAIPVFTEAYANVFMSGTLLPLKMYRELFGMEDAVAYNYASPFPSENRLCVIDDRISTKYTERSIDMYREIAARISTIRKATKGSIVVFFPSFEILNSVYRYMEIEVNHIQRCEMKSAAVENMLKGFKGSDDSMMFAVMGGSFSEGTDYPNNIIKGLIIVGIPLEKPNLETNSRIAYMDRRFGKGSEYAYLIPGVIKAVQAAGRAVRSPDDRAFVVFMDKRYRWGTYRSILNNFMEITKTEGEYINEVARFNSGASEEDRHTEKDMARI